LRDIELPNTIERLKYGNFYKELIKFVFVKKFKEKLIQKYNKLVALDNVYVITASFYSKASIEFYLDNSKDVVKIYPPVQKELLYTIEENNNILKKIDIKKKKYILMTGSERWSKNTKYVTKAISELFNKKDYKIDILILGANPNSVEKYNGFNVIHYDYLDDADFEEVMKNAFLFVYPSLNEGFGYPPLYAMKLGTPVIASSISSIAEVLSSGSLYFCPLEKDDIILKVDTLISNSDYREQLIEDGYKRYKRVEELQREDFKKVLNLLTGK
jgi:glycosyltransferase involved in cell wall biosynthesis